jgi:hypothetical protein
MRKSKTIYRKIEAFLGRLVVRPLTGSASPHSCSHDSAGACCAAFSTSALIDHYGADANMVDLRLTLAAGCPKIAAGKIMDLCGVYYPAAGSVRFDFPPEGSLIFPS